MKRRTALAALATAWAMPAAPLPPTQLHVDLTVEAAHENALKETFEKVFRPTIRKQPGFADVKLLKFRVGRAGQAPAGCTHRLLISFITEEERQTWVASADHQRVWPQMEKHLKLVTALVYDPIA